MNDAPLLGAREAEQHRQEVEVRGLRLLLRGAAGLLALRRTAGLRARRIRVRDRLAADRQELDVVLGGAVVIRLASGKGRGGWFAALPVALVAADLIGAGIGYNPTARPEEVYPETESIPYTDEDGNPLYYCLEGEHVFPLESDDDDWGSSKKRR